MNYIVKGRKPEQLFRYFEDIAAIPHGSGNEAGVADYLVRFAEQRGLRYYRDRVNNMFISMPASVGRENEPPVLLQAHTDMVCEKNAGTVHDFLHDGLELYLDGEFLRARGTTLGADDGIGVAIMLAVLDGAAESHPPIECLFTVSEETGMDGVGNFDFGKITARRMINLDAAGVGTVIAGCAGGVRSRIELCGGRTDDSAPAFEIKLSGLAGGHSGENINEGRANANKLMGRILLALGGFDLRLSSLDGGGKSNAIPRECRAVVTARKNASELPAAVSRIADEIGKELNRKDSAYCVKTKKIDAPIRTFDKSLTERAVAILGIAADGVLKMSEKISGFVEYSRNLGVIVTGDDRLTFTFFARSAINSQLDESCRELEALAALCGATVEYDERYGGWSYAESSPLRDAYCRAYESLAGKAPRVESIHAGLECGYAAEKIPNLDIISVGPDEYDIHSPDERLNLPSVEFLWQVLTACLSAM